MDTDYYEIYNQDHVSLVDLNETPITRIDGNAIVTGDVRHDVDAIVLATGFDAMTGAVMNIDIRGRQGKPRRTSGRRAEGLLGLSHRWLPQFILGYRSRQPVGSIQYAASIEQHVEWISDCIAT